MKNLQLTEEEAYVVDIAIGNLLYHYRKTRERSKGAIEAINQHLQPKLDATLRVRRKLRKPTFVKSHGVSYLAQNDNPWKE